jgi:hypothetical protein
MIEYRTRWIIRNGVNILQELVKEIFEDREEFVWHDVPIKEETDIEYHE